MDLGPGTLVTPNVRLERLLGRGGMGSVWVAEHLHLETRVAVKLISAELPRSDPAILERFKREAKAAARLRSPHVVQIFDHGTMEGGTPYIVMELCEGETLAERLEREGTLGLLDTAVLVSQVAKALGEAHAAGIVHRDIKPANIFLVSLQDELWAKVLDFGVAKHSHLSGAGGVTATGALLGTPDYMSPEQLLSAREVDQRADLWALAVVAYHCLTGRPAFAAETLAATIVAISNASFPLPSSLGLGLSAELDRFFARALARQPERRFGSAKEMAGALLAVAQEATGRRFPLSISATPAPDAAEPAAAASVPGSRPHEATAALTVLGEPAPSSVVPAPAPPSEAPRSAERTVLAQPTFSGSSSTVDGAEPARLRWLRALAHASPIGDRCDAPVREFVRNFGGPGVGRPESVVTILWRTA
ncbi:MAG: serine/threonine protein kinase [Deltaproteobacteria bacterium]|nr:serine/threonine protein kinase [Deltaproteobacteria bacterium]